MGEHLLSVGLDVGTTTSQMIVSELTVENRASAFAVPELDIVGRSVRYRGEVIFTPLLSENLVDAAALARWVEEEYRRAGITRETVDTGAVIITGETSRRENARAVMEHLSELAGDFVVATAGPDLESVLSSRGAGAVARSQKENSRILHMDIGGGTSNLTLIEEGKILRTGCLNVGGRLIKLKDGVIQYVSPVLKNLTTLQPGEKPGMQELESLAQCLTQALEMAAGLREPSQLLEQLLTRETEKAWIPPRESCTLSFSGGVSECIAKEFAPFAFGDLGPILGQAIRRSRLCADGFYLGEETIRATVIGAGCHSAQLSGSTVFYRNITFPLKNLPVLPVSPEELSALGEKLRQQDSAPIVALQGVEIPSYGALADLAQSLAEQFRGHPVYLCMEQDMAKALGQLLCLKMGRDTAILCIDRVSADTGSFLDVGEPIGPALPVVVKTLVFEK